ncbi:Low temperature viability protein-domain-containing protein [Mycena floridula]|nr:Low temperature viability protein-domain-containing protein [Mycena floridula]
MAPKSIFRQPGAQHFQLVHRSQRDPLIHDPDASQHVLKHVVRENTKKGKSRAQLEELIETSGLDSGPGEAALYGIYYDDTEYDYMQHLRPIGVEEEGVDSILIEAPSSSKQKAASGKKATVPITLKDLPQDVLPSTYELPRTYQSQQDIPDSIAGFQPDMDPHLRQVLEALEDEAFVDDDLEDDFFGELVKAGERTENDEVDFEFHEDLTEGEQEEVAEDGSWQQQFAQFKKQQHVDGNSDDEHEDESEGEDTISGLPSISVIGGKKRRKGNSDASGYSMSSSSMFRNEALQTLDEKFDQVMLKQYNSDDEDSEEDSDASDETDDAPQLITSREDFTAMMDEFLDDYEILGRKLKPKLAGDTGMEKLDTLRRAMGQDERVRVNNEDSGDEEDDLLEPAAKEKDRWDCETILTTYSNLENHPRLIRARNTQAVPKIILDPKTGLPSIAEVKRSSRPRITDNDSSDESENSPIRVRQTISRPRDESPETKKARKALMKAERATRRADKKATKEVFGNEFKVQSKMKTTRGMRKL